MIIPPNECLILFFLCFPPSSSPFTISEYASMFDYNQQGPSRLDQELAISLPFLELNHYAANMACLILLFQHEMPILYFSFIVIHFNCQMMKW